MFAKKLLAAALGLLEENSPSSSLTAMIQSMNRFLLDRISYDLKQLSPNSAQMEKVCCSRGVGT